MNKISLYIIPIIFSSNVQAHEASQLVHLHGSDCLNVSIITFIMIGTFITIKLATKKGGSNV